MLTEQSEIVVKETQGMAETGFQTFVEFMLIVLAVSFTMWVLNALFNRIKKKRQQRKSTGQMEGHQKKQTKKSAYKPPVEQLQHLATETEKKKILDEQREEWKRQQERNRR